MKTKLRRNLPPSIVVKPQPGVEAQEHPLWDDPKGLDYINPVTKVDEQHLDEMKNMVVELGQTFSRPGSVILGVSGTNVMAVVKFITISGRAHILRFTTTSVSIYRPFDASFQLSGFQSSTLAFQDAAGTGWFAVPGTYTFTGTTADKFCFTTFGNTLVFSNGKDGLYEYDAETGTITLISGSFPCKFLTSFAGRVIAISVRDPNRSVSRIRWCVKDNSHDWSGDGSGYDDLIDTPGGSIDEQMGVFPISETRALIQRATSVWIMVVTGVALTPFRFSRLYEKIGTRSPYAIVPIPGGISIVSSDDIYLINDQGSVGGGIKPIGTTVIKHIRDNADDIQALVGTYDLKHKRLLISSIESGACVMYCFSFLSATWSRRTYPFLINSMNYVYEARPALRVSDLRGSVAQLTGAVEDLGGSTLDNAAVMFTDLTYVHQEDDTAVTDETAPSTFTDAAIELTSGVIRGGGALDRTEMVEMQLELIATVAQTLTVKYSTDGATWTAYGTITLTGSVSVQLVRSVKRIEVDRLQIQLTSATLGGLTLIRVVPMILNGGRIIPA